jgi:cell division protein FtsN
VSRQRVTVRDYKRRTRGQLTVPPERLRGFGFGLAIGLALALVVFIADRRAGQSPLDAPEPRAARHGSARGLPTTDLKQPAAAAAEANAVGNETGSEAGRYDFYQMLPKFEVVVPEREHATRVAPAAPVEQPGTYFLQVGSYRDAAVAERIRAQLSKLAIESTVQRVAVDNDVWHRVRIGPMRDLTQLNRLRQRLEAADLDSLVVRVDD